MRTDQDILLAAGVAGLAWASLAAIVFGLARRPPGADDSAFEARRRERLRKGSFWFAIGEGWVERLARWNARYPAAKLADLARDLKATRLPLPIGPVELIAIVQLQSIAAGVVAFVGASLLLDSLLGGAFVAVLVTYALFQILVGDIPRRARAIRDRLKDRLPFTIDLMALMMEAGATFPECLVVAVRENAGHPLGDELEQVRHDTEMGKPRRDALLDFRSRVPDPDLEELLFAIVKGEELGTPLKDILRTQANQMRLKRSQRQEKESAEAQVSIVFPGMVIMLACLLIITAPFLLQAIMAGAGGFSF